jgi:hypothetical protein
MENLGVVSESLDTELKSWLSLDDPRHAAIIARACIALRNLGGGRLILGIDDKTLQSLNENRPSNITECYHPDRVNEVVGQYALPKFEVRVAFKLYEEKCHPELTVPSGVSFPVITRAPYEKELRQNAVYVRTVANGRPSSCEPRTPQDWQNLIEACFNNREADIGRFFRRHLPNIVAQMKTSLGLDESTQSAPEPFRATRELLDFGRTQFEKRWNAKVVSAATEPPQPIYGTFEVAAKVDGSFTPPGVRDVLNKVFMHQPHLTGWPTWVDSRSFREIVTHPYVTEGGWEALIYTAHGWHGDMDLDFWRIESSGRFYLLREFEDDTTNSLRKRGVEPGTVYDFLLLISRTAEACATIRAFATGLEVEKETGAVEFAFRWSGLKGRQICCWVEPGRSLMTNVRAEDDMVISTCRIPLDAPDNALWRIIKDVVQPVFDVFGAAVGDQVIEDIVNRTITRRL